MSYDPAYPWRSKPTNTTYRLRYNRKVLPAYRRIILFFIILSMLALTTPSAKAGECDAELPVLVQPRPSTNPHYLNDQIVGDLMNRAASGDGNAKNELGRLLLEHLPKIVRAVARKMQFHLDEEKVDDVTSDVIQAIIRAKYNFDPTKSNIGVWLTIIVRRRLEKLQNKKTPIRIESDFIAKEDEPSVVVLHSDTSDTHVPERSETNKQMQAGRSLLTRRDALIIDRLASPEKVEVATLRGELGLSHQGFYYVQEKSIASYKKRLALIESGRGIELAEALNQLPPKEKEALILLSLDDVSDVSTAKQLAVSQSELKKIESEAFTKVLKIATNLPEKRRNSLLRDLLELNTPQTKRLRSGVKHFLSTGNYPNFDNCCRYPGGPDWQSLFISKAHLEWALGIEIEKAITSLKEKDTPTDNERFQLRRLSRYDPFQVPISRSDLNDPLASLFTDTHDRYRQSKREEVVNSLLDRIRALERLPTREEMAEGLNMPYQQIMGIGSRFGHNGPESFRSVFSSPSDWETTLEKARTDRLSELSAAPTRTSRQQKEYEILRNIKIESPVSSSVDSPWWKSRKAETLDTFMDLKKGALAAFDTIENFSATSSNSSGEALLKAFPHLSGNLILENKIKERVTFRRAGTVARTLTSRGRPLAAKQIQDVFYWICEAHNNLVKLNPGNLKEIDLTTIHTLEGARNALYLLRGRVSELYPERSTIFVNPSTGAIAALKKVDGFSGFTDLGTTADILLTLAPHLASDPLLAEKVRKRVTHPNAGYIDTQQLSKGRQVQDAFFWICEAHNQLVSKSPALGKTINLDAIHTIEGAQAAIDILKGNSQSEKGPPLSPPKKSISSNPSPEMVAQFADPSTGGLSALLQVEGISGQTAKGTTADALLKAFPHLSTDHNLRDKVHSLIKNKKAGVFATQDEPASIRQLLTAFSAICEAHNAWVNADMRRGKLINLQDIHTLSGMRTALFTLRGRVSELKPEQAALFKDQVSGAIAALKGIPNFQGLYGNISTGEALLRHFSHLKDRSLLHLRIRNRISNRTAGKTALSKRERSQAAANQIYDAFYWLCDAHNEWLEKSPHSGPKIDLENIHTKDGASAALQAIEAIRPR